MAAIRIGTRESQLALWQAKLVQRQLKATGVDSELVLIKSEGDVDTTTPLYALGVTGIFTKTLDAALLSRRIDIAVHSMKDVPVQLAKGIQQAAVLERGSHKDIFVPHPQKQQHLSAENLDAFFDSQTDVQIPTIATSSIRRIAQWLNKFPSHQIDNLRGNVNTRLRKLEESDWQGAIFAAAGLERINLRPPSAVDLDFMLPAPAQGAIMVVCKAEDKHALEACQHLNHEPTAVCTRIERDFLSALMGGCSTPISALAEIRNGTIYFRGNIVTPNGKQKAEINKVAAVSSESDLGWMAANEILTTSGKEIVDVIRKKG